MQGSEQQHGGGERARSRAVWPVVCLGLLAGILIWSKLRLVSPLPRSVYADPPVARGAADTDSADRADRDDASRDESEADEAGRQD